METKAHQKAAQVPRWWLGRVPVGRTSGSVPLPEAPAHCLGWVQLVSQSRLLAQAESAAVGAAFSPLLQPVPSSVLSSPHAQGTRGGRDLKVTQLVRFETPPWAWEPYPLVGCCCCVRQDFRTGCGVSRVGPRGCPMAGWARPGLVFLAQALSGSQCPLDSHIP